jgi:hypothetical protein
MPTRFILTPPVEAAVFEREMRLPKESEHHVFRSADGSRVESITVDTESDAEILEIESELRNSLNITPIVERGASLGEA